MKDDYLWDNTGKDSEIEKIESSLSMFRYKPIDAPKLSVAESEGSRRRIWDLRYVLVPAFAAIVIGAVVAGLWFRTSSDEIVAKIESGIESRRPAQSDPATGDKIGEINPQDAPLVSPPHKAGGQGDPRVAMANRKRAIGPKRKGVEPALTREEKYAYDRLMLALSITGSKLRMVQDKVNGLEVEKTGSKNER